MLDLEPEDAVDLAGAWVDLEVAWVDLVAAWVDLEVDLVGLLMLHPRRRQLVMLQARTRFSLYSCFHLQVMIH